MVFLQHFICFESVLSKIVFLFSDGASVNSGKDSGLIRLLQEDFPWISFIWCFSHQLELALKGTLKEFVELLDTSLMHLFYLYKKSSKKLRELKNFYHNICRIPLIQQRNPKIAQHYKESLQN